MSDMRILIIEDDRDAAAYLAKAFREAGHVADQANDGLTGYDLALEGVWDYHFDPQTNVIDVHISRLRQAIDKDFDKPLLHTVRGAGYSLREDE